MFFSLSLPSFRARQNKDTTKAQETQITFSKTQKKINKPTIMSKFLCTVFLKFFHHVSVPRYKFFMSTLLCNFEKIFWFNAKKCNKNFPVSIEKCLTPKHKFENFFMVIVTRNYDKRSTKLRNMQTRRGRKGCVVAKKHSRLHMCEKTAERSSCCVPFRMNWAVVLNQFLRDCQFISGLFTLRVVPMRYRGKLFIAKIDCNGTNSGLGIFEKF